MQAAATATRRDRHMAMHYPVEESTPEGRIRISCADPACAGWDPRPFESRREAQFWYDRHISQPLTHHL